MTRFFEKQRNHGTKVTRESHKSTANFLQRQMRDAGSGFLACRLVWWDLRLQVAAHRWLPVNVGQVRRLSWFQNTDQTKNI